MAPDEVADIFTAANAAYETATIKSAYADIENFDEIVNELLVDLIREHDGDEHGMLYLSQDPSKCSNITGSNLSKIGST